MHHIKLEIFQQAGAALGARAISHLEEVSDAGIAAMAKSGTVAVVLPTTAYMLRLSPPPVRNMIEAGVAVALGSDFNPNAHCLSMVSSSYDPYGSTRHCVIIMFPSPAIDRKSFVSHLVCHVRSMLFRIMSVYSHRRYHLGGGRSGEW